MTCGSKLSTSRNAETGKRTKASPSVKIRYRHTTQKSIRLRAKMTRRKPVEDRKKSGRRDGQSQTDHNTSLDQVIQRLRFSSSKLCLHAMGAEVVFQEFVNVTNGLERGRKLFCFFWKDTIGRQPVMKVQICHGLCEGWTNAAQQHRHSARLHVMQKMIEAFE